MDKARYQAAIEAFRKTLADYKGGWDDAEARSAMLNGLTTIKITSGDMSFDGYFSGIIHKLERYIDELYSPRKHLKYKTASRSGVEELRSRIFSQLYRLDRLPLEVGGRSQDV